MKAYLFTFESSMVNPNMAHTVVTGSSMVRQWWHYLPGTYIVLSDNNSIEISEDFSARGMGNNWFIVIEVRADAGGRLPVEAWNWINSNISL